MYYIHLRVLPCGSEPLADDAANRGYLLPSQSHAAQPVIPLPLSKPSASTGATASDDAQSGDLRLMWYAHTPKFLHLMRRRRRRRRGVEENAITLIMFSDAPARYSDSVPCHEDIFCLGVTEVL